MKTTNKTKVDEMLLDMTAEIDNITNTNKQVKVILS